MEVTVVTRQLPSGASVVFGVYKSQESARSAIRLFFRTNYPNADCSICGFSEQQMTVEE